MRGYGCKAQCTYRHIKYLSLNRSNLAWKFESRCKVYAYVVCTHVGAELDYVSAAVAGVVSGWVRCQVSFYYYLLSIRFSRELIKALIRPYYQQCYVIV